MRKTHPDKLYTHLEKTGEDEVRKRLAAGRVYGEDKVALVRDWLDRKAQERASVVEREKIEIARDAATAARDAADAARSANTRAKIALIIAATTAIALIIDLVVQWNQTNGGQIP